MHIYGTDITRFAMKTTQLPNELAVWIWKMWMNLGEILCTNSLTKFTKYDC